MSTMSHGSPPVARERWSLVRDVPEMWASLAIAAMWVAVFVTVFAFLGTWIVARHGFRQHGD